MKLTYDLRQRDLMKEASLINIFQKVILNDSGSSSTSGASPTTVATTTTTTTKVGVLMHESSLNQELTVLIFPTAFNYNDVEDHYGGHDGVYYNNDTAPDT